MSNLLLAQAESVEDQIETDIAPEIEAVLGAPGGADEVHATTEDQHGDHSGVFPPFDPATFPSQLLWLTITFAALYVVLSRVALPRIGSILAERRSRIDADLGAAEADRQKTDAAIAAYEDALASARSKAQGIAAETRDAIAAELASKRAAVEADLAAKIAAAETAIAQTKATALSHVDEIAADTARAVAAQLLGDVAPEAAQAAVAKVKE